MQGLHELDADGVSAAVCYVGVGSREQALAIARVVVGERLAAGANVIDGVSSIYRGGPENLDSGISGFSA